MLRSKPFRLALLAVAVAIALLLLFYPTDEKRVREVAEELVAAANESEGALSIALQKHASPNVTVLITDLREPLEGQGALVAAAARTRVMGKKLRFRMEQVEVSVEGNHARLNADLVASLQLGLREHRQARRSTVLFEKVEGRFLFMSAEVGSERHDQPEARP